MKLNWNFQRGGGLNIKTFPWRGYGYFWNNTSTIKNKTVSRYQSFDYFIFLQAKQIRERRRDEVLEQKRKTGKQGSPPHLIVSISFIDYKPYRCSYVVGRNEVSLEDNVQYHAVFKHP